MANKNFTVRLPMIQQAPPKVFVEELPQMLIRLHQYDGMFTAACKAQNVPKAIAFAIACVESNGKHNDSKGKVIVTGREKSTGMMQVGAEPIYDMIDHELRKGRLSPQAIAVFKKYAPGIWNGDKLKTYSPAVKAALQKGLENVECNIWASVCFLRKMMELHADDSGVVQLDRVIIKYNAGEYSEATKFPEFKPAGDSTALYNKVAREANIITAAYIAKMVGKGGAVAYMVRNGVA